MKKFLVLILICLICLSACDTSKGEASEVSDEESVFFSVSDEVSAEDVYSPVDKAEVLSAAEKLIEADIALMGIFAGGALSDGSGEKDYANASGEYEDYSALTALAESTYGEKTVIDRMLSYPDYGDDAVISEDGKTKYKYTYINDFAASAKKATVTVVSFDDETATLSVSLSGKTFTMGMQKVSGGWRLTDSVYFAYLRGETDTQLSEGWENSIYLGSRQNAGSAASLKGKILVLNVFLNDTFTEWTDTDRKKVEDTVDTACEWLVTKSRGYNAVLAIDTQSLFYVHSDTVPSNYEMAFLDIMFQKTVYVDVNGYVERNTPDGYDGVCVLFHVWKNGDDYCIPCDTANTDYHTYYGERAMFYYSKNAGHDSSSYVYMLLQLFGGEKLYGREDTDEIKALFPDDILLQKNFLSLPLQSHSVSPLTAFLIGWSGYIDTQLIPFTDIQGD